MNKWRTDLTSQKFRYRERSKQLLYRIKCQEVLLGKEMLSLDDRLLSFRQKKVEMFLKESCLFKTHPISFRELEPLLLKLSRRRHSSDSKALLHSSSLNTWASRTLNHNSTNFHKAWTWSHKHLSTTINSSPKWCQFCLNNSNSFPR